MADQINYRRHGMARASSVSLAAAGVGMFDASDPIFNRRLDTEENMPALDSATVWLNSTPLTTDELRGKVVAIDFWTYTCINWLRTLPYVRAWAETYREQGLVVIGVHTPELSRRCASRFPSRSTMTTRSGRRSTTTTGPRCI
jgi:thiol-disulfide isomerase/thioredoxin